MIGLHGSQREADVLAGLLALLNDPKQYAAKITALNEAAQQHQAMMEGARQAKLEANKAAEQYDQQIKVAEATQDALRQQLAREAHMAAVAAHRERVTQHERKEAELGSQLLLQEAQVKALQQREEAVRQAEAQHAERSRKLRELLG